MMDLRDGLEKMDNRDKHKNDLRKIRRALEMRAEGNSYAAVGEAVGVDGTTVRRWAVKYREYDDFWRQVNAVASQPIPTPPPLHQPDKTASKGLVMAEKKSVTLPIRTVALAMLKAKQDGVTVEEVIKEAVKRYVDVHYGVKQNQKELNEMLKDAEDSLDDFRGDNG